MMMSAEEVLIGRDYVSLLQSKKVTSNETIPMIRKKVFQTSDYLNRLQNLSTVESSGLEVLPLNCRYLKTLGNLKILVVEEDPKVRTIKLDITMDSTIEKLKITGKLKEYGFENFLREKPPYLISLSFPYIVYIISLARGRLMTFSAFFRLSPITSLSDYLLVASLTNIDSSHYVCLRSEEKDLRDESIYGTVTEAVERFWLNSFNVDYIDHYLQYQEVPEICDFLTWNYFTRNDPMFIFDVNWIRNKRTLGEQIERIRHDLDYTKGYSLSHKGLVDLFSEEQKVNIEKGERVEKLVSSDCEAIFIQSKELTVGESLQFKSGKEFYVSSFFGENRRAAPSHVQIEDSGGRFRIFKLTKRMLSLLEKRLDKTKFLDSIQLSSGALLKSDDIVEVGFPFKAFKKVRNIRVSRDDRVEVKLAKDYYLAESLEAKVVDSSNQSIGGVKLVKDREYFISSSPQNKIFKSYRKGKFIGVECLENSTKLCGKFLIGDCEVNVDVDNGTLVSTLVYEIQNFVRVSTYRAGMRIYTDHHKETYLTNKEILYQDNIDYKRDLAESDIIKDGEIEIKSFDLDINFKIDDEVVYVDWTNPALMTNPYKIVGFISRDDILYMKLKREDNEQEVPYIHFDNGIINIGKIRKVSSEFDGVVVGSKIKAKVVGIPGFPKKNINIIIGFITDTGGLPLVLCSNYCTLWPFDLEKFDIIPRSSRRWSRLLCSIPRLSKFKFQSGDLYVEKNDEVYLIASDRSGNLYRRTFSNFGPLSNYHSVRFERDNVVSRYGIYTPRYTYDQLMELTRITGLPNLHGLITERNSELYFRLDRRAINV